MIIAIDGPAASGKSTTAKIVAEKLGFTYLDTGAMYRCVTLAMINAGIHVSNTKQINDLLENISIDLLDKNGKLQIMMNNLDVSDDIRSGKVTENVSAVSALKNVREAMVKMQRNIASKTNCVMEGRDIGTVVFPNAEYKFLFICRFCSKSRTKTKRLISLGR